MHLNRHNATMGLRAGCAAGFTLMELMVVIGIIGMIVAVAMPQLLPLLSFSTHEGAARRAVQDQLGPGRERRVDCGGGRRGVVGRTDCLGSFPVEPMAVVDADTVGADGLGAGDCRVVSSGEAKSHADAAIVDMGVYRHRHRRALCVL